MLSFMVPSLFWVRTFSVRMRFWQRLWNRVGNAAFGSSAKAIRSEPVRGHVQIEIPPRANRQARRAKMAVRWLSLDVHAPCHGPKRPALRLTFLLIEEIDPPLPESGPEPEPAPEPETEKKEGDA